MTILVSVPFFIILHFIILRRTLGKAIKFANFEALSRVTGGRIMNKNLTALILRLWAFILLVLALAGTVVWYTGQSTESDFMLAIDTSSSMLANDLEPSRLAAAKFAAISFIENIPGGSDVGLLTFSGTALVTQFPSNDYGQIRDAIEEIQPSRVSGTDIGNAIITGVNLLIGNHDRPRAIIILTDGKDNVGINLEQAIDYANLHQTVVHTIGVGTEEGGSFIQAPGQQTLLSQLDEEELRQISEDTGGLWFVARNEAQITEAYESIATIREQLIPFELAIPGVLLALILLFIEWGILNTRFRS